MVGLPESPWEATMRSLIINGIVVNADGSARADVLIEGERIVAVGLFGEGSDRSDRSGALGAGPADHTIDARGRLVIPGGIDVHTHMELPF
jgi:dihydropyrimidinase